MRDKEILRIGGVSSDFCIKVKSAWFNSAMIQYNHHGFDRIIEIGGEIIGIPSILMISSVGIDAAQMSRFGGYHQIVCERVVGQCGVVGFDIEFEIIQQILLSEKSENGGRVKVILMFGRRHVLWLDDEISFETNYLAVICCGF